MSDTFNEMPGEAAEMELRLWNYLDGNATGEERSAIEKLIADNIEWRAKYQELLEVNQLLQSAELDSPSLRFTKNVMEEIARTNIAPATRNYINRNIIRGIGFFFITLILVFLVYGFGQIDWGAGSGESVGIDFSKVDYGRIFNNTYINVFMMINVVAGLFFLDRFLASKRKKFQEEA